MEHKITGVMVYYYFVCKRKLWYFCHQINMEEQNETVMLGKLLDESSYKRNEKHINIDDVINIDFVKEYKEIHEVKKSKAIEEASIWQVKYYLYYLKNRGVDNLSAKIDYPLIKKNLSVSLQEDDINVLESAINDIMQLKKLEFPPIFEEKRICKNCAYHDLCFI